MSLGPPKYKLGPRSPAPAPAPAAARRDVVQVRVDLLPLASIRLDGGTQARAGTNAEHVARLREVLDSLPPVVVFHDGAAHWLADGFHRFHAHREEGRAELRAEIRGGTLSDAKLYAAGANYAHGLPRSAEDKRASVLMLLQDGTWAPRSDRWLADQAHVSGPFVAKVRKEATANACGSPRVGKDGKERKVPAPRAVHGEAVDADEAAGAQAKNAVHEAASAEVVDVLVEAKSSAAPPPPAAADPALPDEPKPGRVSADDPPDTGTLADEARDALETAWAYVNDRMHPAAPFDALRAEWKRLDAHMAKLEKARAA